VLGGAALGLTAHELYSNGFQGVLNFVQSVRDVATLNATFGQAFGIGFAAGGGAAGFAEAGAARLGAAAAEGVAEAASEGVAEAAAEGGTTTLFRAVSDAELVDVADFGFRPGPGQMETKLFATSAEDAGFFARDVLFPLDRKPLTVLETRIPNGLASRLTRITADGRPTVAVDPSLLEEFNAAAQTRALDFIPIPGKR
jgi:hypothetical protein